MDWEMDANDDSTIEDMELDNLFAAALQGEATPTNEMTTSLAKETTPIRETPTSESNINSSTTDIKSEQMILYRL